MNETIDENICFICEAHNKPASKDFYGVLPILDERKGLMLIGKLENSEGEPVSICKTCLASALFNLSVLFFKQTEDETETMH